MADGTAARVIRDSGEQVVVAVPSGSSGQLVLADSWYPGWTATAGGRTLPVTQVDGYLRGVDVPSGATTVTFVYQPGWLWPSVGASGLALLLTLGLLAWPGLRRAAAGRRRSAPETRSR
jgi:uncharacterized membrane protein YfhO